MGVQSVFGAALALHVAEVCLCNVSLGSWGESLYSYKRKRAFKFERVEQVSVPFN